MSAIRKYTATPKDQTEKTRPDQVKNHAGGYVYTPSDKDRLERFLILGTDGGSYYVEERKLTDQNLKFIDDLITSDPDLVAAVTGSVSRTGRALRNTPAVYVAARMICLVPDGHYKHIAKRLINDVCRTSTHIFELCGFIDSFGGWGQAKMDAVRMWYESKSPEALKYQAVKYRGGRYGWTHRDVLRTVHPKRLDDRTAKFMLGKPQFANLNLPAGDIIDGLLLAQSARTSGDILQVLGEYPMLPREAIPTQFARDPDIWKALFYNGQLTGQGLLRNIRTLFDIGAFNDIAFAANVSASLRDTEMIRKTRLHPMQYIFALNAIGALREVDTHSWHRGNNPCISASGPVVDGLESGFYAAFRFAPQIPGSTLLAVDVSGSMGSPIFTGAKPRPGAPAPISCAQGAGAMAMVVARLSPAYMIRGFSGDFVDLGISASDRMPSVFRKINDRNFGSTDCALPMTWALKNGAFVDTFVVLTDNETGSASRPWGYGYSRYQSRIHPDAALRDYRKQVNPNARLVVVGMSANEFTVADPKDRGMMDVCGFDTNVPQLISDFAGKLLGLR